jgi:hypothetical protein
MGEAGDLHARLHQGLFQDPTNGPVVIDNPDVLSLDVKIGHVIFAKEAVMHFGVLVPDRGIYYYKNRKCVLLNVNVEIHLKIFFR